jgi:diphthamide biosynthesis protein 7
MRPCGFLATPAIFDMKWSPRPLPLAGPNGAGTSSPDRAVQTAALALACSHATISLAAFSPTTEGSGLAVAATGCARDPASQDAGPASAGAHVSVLSLDWSNRAAPDADPAIAASQSDGTLQVWRLAQGSARLRRVASWRAHAYPGGAPAEAWITAFDAFSPHVLLSGADDARLLAWDLRADPSGEGPAQRAPRAEHGAGVTAAQSHPHLPHALATGSYDGVVRLWDARRLGSGPVARWRPALGAEGGVWRLKWHPAAEKRGWLLAACMRGGAHVLCVGRAGAGTHDPGTGKEGVRVRAAASYTKHESMAYGADWVRSGGREDARSGSALLLTCSFYDRALHLWRAEGLA